jgi:putative FmdB family regulatory protein
MPTYDYRCKACGHTWELFQSMSAKHVKACPSCGKQTAERLIGTGAAVMFKGSGFYQTDYRSDSYRKAAAADKPASDAPAKSDAAKTPTAKDGGSSAPASSATSATPAPAAAAPAPAPERKAGKASGKRGGAAKD